MLNDHVQVTVVFTPVDEYGLEPGCGVFTFAVQDLIDIREEFVAHRVRHRKGRAFLAQQSSKPDFDWNAWVHRREDSTLASLIAMGFGKVLCQSCSTEYPTKAITTYEWTWQNWGGLQFACPQEHVLFTHTNKHGEFIEPDDRQFVKVRCEKDVV